METRRLIVLFAHVTRYFAIVLIQRLKICKFPSHASENPRLSSANAVPFNCLEVLSRLHKLSPRSSWNFHHDYLEVFTHLSHFSSFIFVHSKWYLYRTLIYFNYLQRYFQSFDQLFQPLTPKFQERLILCVLTRKQMKKSLASWYCKFLQSSEFDIKMSKPYTLNHTIDQCEFRWVKANEIKTNRQATL